MKLEQVIKEKEQLEAHIRQQIISFQEKTNTKVVGIDMVGIQAPNPNEANEFITTNLDVNLQVDI